MRPVRCAALKQAAATLAGTALLTTSTCAQADSETWIEEGVFQALHVADLGQTLDIRRARTAVNPDGFGYRTLSFAYHEENGLLSAGWAIGPHPSDRSIYAYFAAEALVHAAVSWELDRLDARWPERAWQAVTISIQSAVIGHNASIGLQVRF